MLDPRQAARARPGLSSPVPRRPAHPDQASASGLRLLGEVLARLNGTARPVVQVVCASPGRDAGRVAQDLAVAAASRFGRTLLASPAGAAAAQEAGARGLSWLMNDFGGGPPDGMAPDPMVPGLYYTTLGADAPGPFDVPVEAWLAAPQAFRMLVIESPAITADPRTLATASRCHGAVLVVGAGVTTLAELRAAARQLGNAGIPLLGTVLQDAPQAGSGLKRHRRAG